MISRLTPRKLTEAEERRLDELFAELEALANDPVDAANDDTESLPEADPLPEGDEVVAVMIDRQGDGHDD